MSLESLFLWLATHRLEVVGAIFMAPWLTWGICQIIPGRREEAWILSLNLWIAVISLLMLAGYLAYASNTGGWSLVVKQADILLLFAPPYYAIASLWMSRQRMPLSYIPAFRTLQGFVVMGAVYFVLAALFSRVRIYFFSYLPFSAFLWILAVLLGLGYWGYRRMVDGGPNPSRHYPSASETPQSTASHATAEPELDQELEKMRRKMGL
ncbi:MAG: hypothetical protein WCD18_21105 [Thermosynechococcaceae cyanobacterium]